MPLYFYTVGVLTGIPSTPRVPQCAGDRAADWHPLHPRAYRGHEANQERRLPPRAAVMGHDDRRGSWAVRHMRTVGAVSGSSIGTNAGRTKSIALKVDPEYMWSTLQARPGSPATHHYIYCGARGGTRVAVDLLLGQRSFSLEVAVTS